MVRVLMGGALLVVAVLGVTQAADGCEACGGLVRQRTVEGKLIREVAPNDPTDVKDILHFRWVLKTPDKKYHLNLGSRTLTRQADALEGRDVAVTGRIDGDTISVRDIEAKEESFTGVLEGGKGKWRLVVEGKTFWDVSFASRTAARQAQKLAGQSVTVKARPTISGLIVSSVEAAK